MGSVVSLVWTNAAKRRIEVMIPLRVVYIVLAECHRASTCVHWRTYMLPVQNVRLSPNLSLVESDIRQMTGSGRMSMQRSVMIFGKVEYRKKAFWLMQWAP